MPVLIHRIIHCIAQNDSPLQIPYGTYTKAKNMAGETLPSVKAALSMWWKREPSSSVSHFHLHSKSIYFTLSGSTVVLASIIGRLAQNKLFGLQGVKIC